MNRGDLQVMRGSAPQKPLDHACIYGDEVPVAGESWSQQANSEPAVREKVQFVCVLAHIFNGCGRA